MFSHSFQDLIYCAVYILFYFIADCVLAAQSCGKDSNKAGAVSCLKLTCNRINP